MDWELDYRNAKYITESIIGCEITHPTLGWIPYTLNPEDQDIIIDNNVLLEMMAQNEDVAPYVPKPVGLDTPLLKPCNHLCQFFISKNPIYSFTI